VKNPWLGFWRNNKAALIPASPMQAHTHTKALSLFYVCVCLFDDALKAAEAAQLQRSCRAAAAHPVVVVLLSLV